MGFDLHDVALKVPTHAASPEESDYRGGTEGDVPGIDSDPRESDPQLRKDAEHHHLEQVHAGRANSLHRSHVDGLYFLREQLAGKTAAWR